MQAFKLNKLFVATALALAFGPGARVVEAASLCGIPGASQMGMGCGGNTGTADSTLVPNVGPAPQLPNGGTTFLPSGGGGNTVSGFLAENAGRKIAVYEAATGPYYNFLVGDIVIEPTGASFVPVGYSPRYNKYFPISPVRGTQEQSATPLSPIGDTGSWYISYNGEAFDGNWGDNYLYDYIYGSGFQAGSGLQASSAGIYLTPYGIGVGFCPNLSSFSQDQLNAGAAAIQIGQTGDGASMSTTFCPYTPPTTVTCFPAGSTVLMADGRWKAIEMVNVGDWLMGADGDPVQPHKIDRPLLGSRRMMAMADDSLLWSEEHGMWTRDSAEDSTEWWWSASPDRWRAEVENGTIGGLHDNESMRTGDGFDFAHLEGWKSQNVIEARGYGPETQLYLPVTDGVPIIVNGYVVGAGINEAGYDYKTFHWNPERIADALARQALLRVMRMTPTHASRAVLAEVMA